MTILRTGLKMALAIAVAATSLTLSAPSFSYGDIEGKVVGVADGDTLTVLRNQTQFRVRLAEIDAPEKAQAFGRQAKQSLSNLCFGKSARVENKGHDRYGRTIGRVWCAGVDISAEQVQRGMAWVYDRYATDKHLYALQQNAQSSKRGLWADPEPVRPWEWRRAKRD